MKTISTLFFALTFGAVALANTETDVKINSIEMGVVLDSGTNGINAASQTAVGTENGLARLYKSQNARVKKALTFDTIHTAAKLV